MNDATQELIKAAKIAAEMLDYVCWGWSECDGTRISWARDKLRDALTNAEKSPEVRELVDKARTLSTEAKLYMLDGEPQPDFVVDPETLAELDTALAKFKDMAG